MLEDFIVVNVFVFVQCPRRRGDVTTAKAIGPRGHTPHHMVHVRVEPRGSTREAQPYLRFKVKGAHS